MRSSIGTARVSYPIIRFGELNWMLAGSAALGLHSRDGRSFDRIQAVVASTEGAVVLCASESRYWGGPEHGHRPGFLLLGREPVGVRHIGMSRPRRTGALG